MLNAVSINTHIVWHKHHKQGVNVMKMFGLVVLIVVIAALGYLFWPMAGISHNDETDPLEMSPKPEVQIKPFHTVLMDEALTRTGWEAGAFVSVSDPNAENRTALWVSRDPCLTQLGPQTRRLMKYWHTNSINCEVSKIVQLDGKPRKWHIEATFTFTTPPYVYVDP